LRSTLYSAITNRVAWGSGPLATANLAYPMGGGGTGGGGSVAVRSEQTGRVFTIPERFVDGSKCSTHYISPLPGNPERVNVCPRSVSLMLACNTLSHTTAPPPRIRRSLPTALRSVRGCLPLPPHPTDALALFASVSGVYVWAAMPRAARWGRYRP
jgi:hypothetical protein